MKVGLALGSGAARGLAHIGVLEVLQREKIPIDMIAGTSAGAVVGALYAYRQDIKGIKETALSLRKTKLRYWLDPAIPRTGLVRGHKIEQMLRATIDDIDFSALRLPFACVATDIESGEEVVINRGIVWKAVRASFTIPGIFTVVKIDDRYLVDGGLVNPVPVCVLPGMGADFVIAVNVIPNISAQDSPRWFPGGKEKAKRKEPSIISILMQSVYIGTHAIAQNCLREADIAIEPQVAHIGPADFQMVDECIKQGQIAAEKALPIIKERLAKKALKIRRQVMSR